MARSEALIPPGPAPTISASRTSGAGPPPRNPGILATIISMQSRPWFTAFLISAHARTRHNHRDGSDGTCVRAKAVANAFVSVDDDSLARQHSQNVALRANHGARCATDAICRVDMGMLRL